MNRRCKMRTKEPRRIKNSFSASTTTNITTTTTTTTNSITNADDA